ncbi:MAG: hypothetical protein NVS4B2_24010 [Chloroflexota bacterium]
MHFAFASRNVARIFRARTAHEWKGFPMNKARNTAMGACASFWQTIKKNPKGAAIIVAFLGLVGLLEGGRIVEEIKTPSIGRNLFGKE